MAFKKTITMKHILEYKKKLNTCAELGWQEVKTTDYIASVLKDAPLKRGFRKGNTGLLYKVGTGSESILLRADIDGLKTAQGIKHTCGHSTHMSALIGAFHYAKSIEKKISQADKSLYFLFQPAEESFPSGAQAFVNECGDIVKQIKQAFTIHVFPKLKLGEIGLQPAVVWARGDYMEIRIKGKMVHIKDNLDGIDALYAASLLIQKIKSIQKKHPSLRVGIGVIEGGRQANTVADFALLKGDIRLKSESQQPLIKSLLKRICGEVEKKTGVQIELSYFDGYPTVNNDPLLTKKVTNDLKRQNTEYTLLDRGLFTYGCEDFAYISSIIPSVTAFIGTGDTYDLHEENCTISDEGTLCAYNYFKFIIDRFSQSQ